MSPPCSFSQARLLFSILPPLRLSSSASPCNSTFLPLRRSFFSSSMPRPRGKQRQWKEKHRSPVQTASSSSTGVSETTERVSHLTLTENPVSPRSTSQFAGSALQSHGIAASKEVWVPNSAYSTASSAGAAPAVAGEKQEGIGLSPSRLMEMFKVPLGTDFKEDNNTFAEAKIRATFYPKFENEKSDQEIRLRIIEMVSQGLATLEVSLKHSGSLFMYAGHEGGAYAKNSFGNIYTAVGVFVLGRMFREAWGKEAARMQSEFNDFLEKNRICISMELVTAVLGDHGQRPKDDYVVVTAVTELGKGKPKFYSTPELIAFCRKWRLPTNHVWLFSTRKSVSAFFAAYDALCEEGTATLVCSALDQIADISVPGSKDHVKVQGEILEGLVARIVSRDSSVHMENILRDFPPPPLDGVEEDLGPSLREICKANRSDEKQQMKALLENVGSSMCPTQTDWFGIGDFGTHYRTVDKSVVNMFIRVHPTDHSTMKLQELIRLMKEKRFSAALKCYTNFHKIDSLSKENLYYKLVIHVHSDHVFRRYQQEMRKNRGLWPLYRGFFVDVNMFKVNKEKASELTKDSKSLLKNINGADSDANDSGIDGLADEDANLMVKLKFLTYKLRTFLIRNGLSILFKDGPSAYKTYYLRQMKNWGTSPNKQQELSKMLDEWAVYIRRKYGSKQLSSSTYLSEAEPFLEQYAKRSPQNQILVGSAGSLVRAEDFLAVIEADRDEEGDLLRTNRNAGPALAPSVSPDVVPKDTGLLVFFPGIPGCAKSALCKEIQNIPGGLGDNRPMHSLMGDLIKGRYWPLISEQLKKNRNSITLADKNAPNEEVWRQIEDMCQRFGASAVPVVPESEGTDTNPFSLDTLAVFIFRVLQRENHPGDLDKKSKNPGYVLLMFYHLYDGKSRKEFERELYERFGSLVNMPVLKPDRDPLPDPIKAILEEGKSLFRLHRNKHGRLDAAKGTYAKEWAQWESRLRNILLGNSDYLNSIQVPFDFAVTKVLEQLKEVAKGENKTPESEKRRFGNIVFAAVSLPPTDIVNLLDKLAKEDSKVKNFLEQKGIANNLQRAHVTLAHKNSHGVAAVASYGIHLQQSVPVEFTALLFSDKLAALEARLGSVNGEKINSKNEWPHSTLWTETGIPAKEANTLPQLVSEGKATRVVIDPPICVNGKLNFF